MFALGGTEQHGWPSARTLVGLGVAAALLAAFIVRRAPRRPAAGPPAHLVDQVAGLRHDRDARRHRDAGRHRLPHLDLRPDRPGLLRAARPDSRSCRWPSPWSSAPTLASAPRRGTSGAASPPSGWSLVAGGALLLSRATATASYATDLLPGLLIIGLGAGMVFVAVSATAMASIPDRARRHGVRLPDDRPRGRRRARCRRTLRSRHGRQAR